MKILNKRISFFFIILLILTFKSQSQEFGLVNNINGKLTFKGNDDQINEVSPYDSLQLNIKYKLNPNSEVSLSFNDGTTLILKEEAEFEFLNYSSIYEVKPGFEIKIPKGDFIIETGEIPKISKNSSVIHTNKGQLYLNGTAVSANLSDKISDIFLMTDSLGNKGDLSLESNDGKKINFEIDKGISFDGENISEKELDQSNLNKMESLKEAIVETATIDEEKITEIINKKINEGKINSQQAAVLLEKITSEKENKLNSIINNSKNDQGMISKIIDKSNSADSENILNKVIEKNPNIVVNIISELASKDSENFKKVQNNELLFTKIIDNVIDNSSDKPSALANIIAKSDSNLSLNIMSTLSDKNPSLLTEVTIETSKINSEKIQVLINNNPELEKKVTENIAKSLENDFNAKEKLKDLMLVSNPKIADSIISNLDKKQNQLAVDAMKLAFKEDPKTIMQKSSEALQNSDSKVAKLLINEAVSENKINVINDLVENAKNNKDLSNNQDTTSSAENLINNLSLNLQEFNNDGNLDLLLKTVNEKLASPN